MRSMLRTGSENGKKRSGDSRGGGGGSTATSMATSFVPGSAKSSWFLRSSLRPAATVLQRSQGCSPSKVLETASPKPTSLE